MKKIFTYLTMAIVAMMTMTSCDRDAMDRAEARTLDGSWVGYIDTYYDIRWGWSTGTTYETAFEFRRTNDYGGWGREVDYPVGGSWGYYDEFRWEIINGRIRLQYQDGSLVFISRYKLYSDYFEGYLEDGTGRYRDVYFKLRYNGSYVWRDSWIRWRNTQKPSSLLNEQAEPSAVQTDAQQTHEVQKDTAKATE